MTWTAWDANYTWSRSAADTPTLSLEKGEIYIHITLQIMKYTLPHVVTYSYHTPWNVRHISCQCQQWLLQVYASINPKPFQFSNQWKQWCRGNNKSDRLRKMNDNTYITPKWPRKECCVTSPCVKVSEHATAWWTERPTTGRCGVSKVFDRLISPSQRFNDL